MSYAYVNHYRNSFIEIIDNGIRILMDPWVNTANEGAWAGSTSGKNYILRTLKKKDVDYIYISHLHTDHFDKSFLMDLKINQKKPQLFCWGILIINIIFRLCFFSTLFFCNPCFVGRSFC